MLRRVIIPFVIVLLLSTTYFLAKLQSRQAEETIISYLDAVLAQDENEITRQLAFADRSLYSGLLTLSRDGLLSYSDVSARATGVLTARGRVVLSARDAEFPISFSLLRRGGRMLIRGVSEVTVLPGAYMVKTDGRNTEFLFKGEGHVFAGAAGTNPESPVVYAAAVDDTLVFTKSLIRKEGQRILAIRSNLLESEGQGFIPVYVPAVYDASTDEVDSLTYGRLVPGMDGVDLYLFGDEIRGIVVREQYIPNSLRVLLNTTNFASLEHRRATLRSSGGLQISDPVLDRTLLVPSGTTVNLIPEGDGTLVNLGGQREVLSAHVFVYPRGGASIEVSSLRRAQGTPAYRGSIEIVSENGVLYVINEVPVEQYLYSVVASEMPVRFGLEALKVQAVAARTYAVAELFSGAYRSYGAHVQDSVASQVYNNISEQALSRQAVSLTEGLIATYQGNVADTKFFSTSSGYTANAHEVWGTDEFPGQEVPYLVARPQTDTAVALNSEEAVAAFLKDWDIEGFDSISPWFRWKVRMSRGQLESVINHNLPARYRVQPNFVLTKDANGGYVSRPVPENPLGMLLDITVVERGAGGNLMTLEVRGTRGTYRIRKELNIRLVIRPTAISSGTPVVIERRDGSTVQNYSILPSAFATFDIAKDDAGRIGSITIYGGGNGHGAGMSQWGAYGMTTRGHSYQDTINHYYPGVSLETIENWLLR